MTEPMSSIMKVDLNTPLYWLMKSRENGCLLMDMKLPIVHPVYNLNKMKDQLYIGIRCFLKHMSCRAMSCHVMSCHVMSCHGMSSHLISDIMSQDTHVIVQMPYLQY